MLRYINKSYSKKLPTKLKINLSNKIYNDNYLPSRVPYPKEKLKYKRNNFHLGKKAVYIVN